MELEYSYYILKTRKPLNRLGDSEKTGVILRSGNAFMDYMPWEALGDLSLSDFLNSVRKRLPDFVRKTFEIDLFPQEVISFKNHAFNQAEPWSDYIKLKYMGDYESLKEAIGTFSNKKLRIDFNNGLSSEQWLDFSSQFLEQDFIDYVEDPYESFRKYHPKVASDFNPSVDQRQIKIYKPLREVKPGNQRLIYSNSMGHPIGVYLSYLHFCQDKSAHQETHGLLMPDFYEKYPTIFLKQDDSFYPDIEVVQNILNELRNRDWLKL